MAFIKTIPPEEATGKLKELYDVAGPAWANLSLRPEAALALRSLAMALRSTMDPRHFRLAYFVAAKSGRCTI